jgi:hypothetical protein
MFASRIEATLGAAGHDVQIARSISEASGLEAMELLIVDLDQEPAEGIVGRGMPVLGFYAHLNTETRESAEGAGVDLVVPRSRMAREMPALVERLVA